ncbi:MAG TPA: DinB family protein [Bacteroidia bacterium]|nr:DinB family protein [Bacteroidia bacterium]
MENKLNQLFGRLEKQRINLLLQLEAYPNTRLNLPTENNKWSVNQIIEHLILAEEISIKSIQAKVLTAKHFESTGLHTAVRKFLLRIFLRSPLKFSAPALVSNPTNTTDFSELKTKWAAVRQQLKELLDWLPAHVLSKCIYKHPVAGKMSIYGGLDFMYEHVRRHRQQIVKVLN